MARKVIYTLLFVVFLLFEIAGVVDMPVLPWLGNVSKYSGISLAVLLLLLIRRADQGQHELKDTLDVASSQNEELKRSLRELAQLCERADTTLRQTETEIDSMRQELHLSFVLLQGMVLFYQQKYEEAAEFFETRVEESPEDPRSNSWLGRSLYHAGKAEQALPYLQTAACGGDPQDVKYLGAAEFRAGRPEDAEQHLLQALKAEVRNKEETLILLARVQRRVPGGRDRAKGTLEAIIEENPYSGDAVVQLADILIKEENWNEAIRVCENALGVNEENWAVYPRYARALFRRNQTGDRRRAEDALGKARAGNPRDRSIYEVEGKDLVRRALTTGDEEERQGLLHRAVAVYDKGLSYLRRPHQAPLRAAKSLAYLALGSEEQAIDEAARAVDSYSDHINNHLALCAALLAKGRLPRLLRAARDARHIGERAGRIWSYLYEILSALFMGDTLEDLGNTIRDFVAALRHMIDFKPQVRDEWPFVQAAIQRDIERLSGRERGFGDILFEYLSGCKTSWEFISSVEKVITQT